MSLDADRLNPMAARIRELEKQLAASEQARMEAEKERDMFRRIEGEAWGIQYCCSGQDCGCQGKPIDPPSWWTPDSAAAIREADARAERAEAERDRLVMDKAYMTARLSVMMQAMAELSREGDRRAADWVRKADDAAMNVRPEDLTVATLNAARARDGEGGPD